MKFVPIFMADRQQIVTGPNHGSCALDTPLASPTKSEQILRVKMAQEREE